VDDFLLLARAGSDVEPEAVFSIAVLHVVEEQVEALSASPRGV
jgi:hypothetical protein